MEAWRVSDLKFDVGQRDMDFKMNRCDGYGETRTHASDIGLCSMASMTYPLIALRLYYRLYKSFATLLHELIKS